MTAFAGRHFFLRALLCASVLGLLGFTCAGSDDPDEDGLGAALEMQHGTDPNNRDSDGDGISDGIEVDGGTDPLVADTDEETEGNLDPTEAVVGPPSEQPSARPGDGQPTDVAATESLQFVVFEDRTCHNFQVGASASAQEVRFATNLPAGTPVRTHWTVTERADGSPKRRPAAGEAEANGDVIVLVPLFGVGETFVLKSVVIDGQPLTPSPKYPFSVAPLDAPDCD